MKNLTIKQWQTLLDKYRETTGTSELFAIRCEDTQLTVGWKFGGFRYNGKLFTSFAPNDESGTPCMLAVREDFLSWATRNKRAVLHV